MGSRERAGSVVSKVLSHTDSGGQIVLASLLFQGVGGSLTVLRDAGATPSDSWPPSSMLKV